uniref:Uncharacterized protein n=1 Tax=Leersia perrieri TaxID=77586 RepID=A0A0D9XQF2_9ORYZ
MASAKESAAAIRGILRPAEAVARPSKTGVTARPSKAGGSKRKAKVGPAAGQPRLLKDGDKEKGKALGGAAAVKCGVTAAAGSAGGDGDEKPPVKVPLPQVNVNAILAMKTEPWPSSEYLDLLSPDERKEREAWATSRRELDKEFAMFQGKVRSEIETTGSYLVEESYLTEQAELQALIKERWNKMDFSGIVVADWDYSDPDCFTHF